MEISQADLSRGAVEARGYPVPIDFVQGTCGSDGRRQRVGATLHIRID